MEAAGVLSVAFGLGLLLHASQAAFFLAINGHLKTLLLHRRRLVLLSLLLCISLFSITQFVTLLLLEDASCEVAVRLSILFDQAARVSALALIAWRVCDEAAVRAEVVVWISVVTLRAVMAGVAVGFTGVAFMPVCFPEPTRIAVGIVHTTFDGCAWAVLGLRVVQIWMLFVEQGRRGGGGKSQGYGLFLIVLGFAAWTVASFPYLMGVGESIFVRMVPYILALALSLGVLGCFPSIVFSAAIGKVDDAYKLQQFSSVSPPTRGRSASSPTFNPADMEANKFTTYPIVGGFDKNYDGGVRNSQMFRGVLGAPIVHPGTALPWSLDPDVPDIARPKPTRAPGDRRPSVASHAGKPSISGPIGPILRNASFNAGERVAEGQEHPFRKIKTVDLKTAAEAERQRIEATFEREQGKKKLQEAGVDTPTPSSVRSISIKRKPVVPQLPSGPAAYKVKAVSELRESVGGSDAPSAVGQSTTTAGVEGSDWGMKTTRTNSLLTDEDDDITRYTSVSHAPYMLAPGPPRLSQMEGMEGGAKVMFMNQIVYDDPALVRSIMGKMDVALTTSRYSPSAGTTVRRSPSSTTQQKRPGMLTPTGEVDEPAMDRPRNAKNEIDRGIFLDSGVAAEMKHKRKHFIVTMGNPLDRATMSTKPLPSLPSLQVINGKSSEKIIFPLPLARVPSVRKPAPPPITITPAMILSPEITQNAPTPNTLKRIPSAKRAASSTTEQQGSDKGDGKQIAYEIAKAWIDSVSAVSGAIRSPYSGGTPEPLPSTAYESTAYSSSISTELRMSLISLTLSPRAKEDEGEFTDIEIDSGSESGEYEDEGEDEDEQTPSEADEMIMSGGEGYSTEEESYEDSFTESDEERQYAIDGVVISDVEDGTTYDKIALAERKLNAKMNFVTDSLSIPNHFQIGDRIPTFSKSRGKYGSRRKPPPSPIAFLMRQRHESQIQARLLLFSGGQNIAPLDGLMDMLPTGKKGDTRMSHISDGRNSLIARLETEVGQQESQWLGLRQDLDSKRSSVVSNTDSQTQRLIRLSQNLAQRRSLLEKLNSGIDRRLSNAQAASVFKVASSPLSGAPSGQQQLAEAQMEYLVQAPSFSRGAGEIPLRPTSILESQHTPISESELDHSEVESPVSIEGAQRRSFYRNDNVAFILEGEGRNQDGDFEEEVEYEEAEEEQGCNEDDVQTLQDTVYSPSIQSANILSAKIQESPIQPSSSTTKAFSKSPVSLLWNPFSLQETAPGANQLWVYRPLSPESPFVFPPGIDLRPKQRISAAPIIKSTSHLWSKPRLTRNAPSAGLWRSAKEFRPKSIIATGRTRNSVKRVTFVEEVVVVGPTGFLGKLKMLWDAPKKISQLAAQAIPLLPKPLKIQSQRTKIKDKLFDAIVVKYANRLLPPLPLPQTQEVARDIVRSALWTKEENTAKRHSNALLWNPAPVAPTLEEKAMFVKDTLEIRTKPRTAALPVLESKNLWGTGKKAVSATLWTKTVDVGRLWPTGSSPARTSPDQLWPSAASFPSMIEFGSHGSHTYRETTALASLESTELWKAVVVELQADEVIGLWFDKSVHAQSQCSEEPAAARLFDSLLWPATAPLPDSYLTVDTPSVRYTRPSITTVATLTSSELWGSCIVADAKSLWSPPAKRSALWPQGQPPSAAPVVVRSLWPSAAPLPFRIELGLHGSHSSRKTLALAPLQSTELWKSEVIELQAEEVNGLWFDKSVQAQSQDSDEPVAIRTFNSLLWPATASPPSSYLIVGTPSVRYTRPSNATITTLTSSELWGSCMVTDAKALWSPPAKKSALWPQGQLSITAPAALSLWPSAASLSSEIELGLHASRSYRETPVLVLESTELWKAEIFELQEEVATGLWFNKTIHAQSPCSEEPVAVRTFDSLLWPATASLPDSYLTVNTPSVRYTRPSTTTTATLTSRELWTSCTVTTVAALWSSPAKRSALWPRGQLLTTAPAAIGGLWPSAAALRSEVEASAVSHSRSPIVTLPCLESTALWNQLAGNERPALWTAPECRSGLWPEGEVLEEVIGNLWPAAPLMPVQYHAFEEALVRVKAKPVALAKLESTGLWRLVEVQQDATASVIVEVDTMEFVQEEQVDGPILWVKKQDALTLTSGYLWPSATLLPISSDPPSSTVPSRFTATPLPRLQSTQLWSLKITTRATLWCLPAKMDGLWPHGKFNKSIDSLWPSAASLPISSDLPSSTIRSRFTATPLPGLQSTQLWSSKVTTRATLWCLPAKRDGLWPHGKFNRTVDRLWPSAASLPVSSDLPLTIVRSRFTTATLSALQSTQLWSPKKIPQDATASVIVEVDTMELVQEEQEAGPMLWVKKQDALIITSGYLWPSATLLPISSDLPSSTIQSRFTATATALPGLQSTQLWSSKITTRATLWCLSAKRDGLWPHGKFNRAIDSLWPSAASLPVSSDLPSTIVRSRFTTATLPALQSSQLWSPKKIQHDATASVIVEVDTMELVQEEQKAGPMLWVKKQDALIVTSGYLWPSATLLPISSNLPSSTIRSRFTVTVLPALQSAQLWSSKITTRATLWCLPAKRDGLWPHGKFNRVIDSLWPSAASLPVSSDLPSTVRSRFTTATISALQSTQLWSSKITTRATLWSLPIKRDGLWPQGESNKVINSLWPSAASLPISSNLPSTTFRSQFTTTLPILQSTQLWSPKKIQQDATASVIVEVDTMELVQEEQEQVAGPMLWVKKQNALIVTSGYLWPSATLLPISSDLPSSTTRPRFTATALPALQSTQLWSLKITTRATLWSLPAKRDGLWPHGKFNKSIDRLWPSAASLPVSSDLPSTIVRSRFTATALPAPQSTQLWSSKITTRATLWSLPDKRNGLWPHGKSSTDVGSLWPSAPSLSVSNLAKPITTTRPRIPTAPTPQIQSWALWSPEPVTKVSLWAAPAIESELWPHGRSAAPTSLWPSASSLPTVSCQEVRNFRTETTTLPLLESNRLWGAASKGSVRPQLWVPEVKVTGLWPSGAIRNEAVMGDLWPSASALPRTDVVVVHSRSIPGELAELESGTLWKACISQELWTRSATAEGGLWPNGMVSTTTRGSTLWCARDSEEIVRRSNLMLRMTGGEERPVKRRGATSTVNAVSGALWSRADERQAEFSGWLLRTQDNLPILNSFDVVESEAKIESKLISAPVTSDLWVKSNPIPDIRFTNALWHPTAAKTTSLIEAPRVRLDSWRTQRKAVVRPDTSRQLPAVGKLWSPLNLSGAHQHTWRQTPHEGLWNTDGTTVNLSQINARSQKNCPLWNRHGRPIFAHLPLTSRYTKRNASLTGSKSATGPLWAPTIKGSEIKDSVFHGLSIITPATTHLLLLPKHDKPLIVVTPTAIPASPVPSRSKVNKRISDIPPLSLASRQASGQMWVTKSVRPRELWRPLPKPGTKKSLPWSPENTNTTPTLKEPATSSETKLWSKLGSTANTLFSDISSQSVRTTRKTENFTIISMEGPLWKSSSVTVFQKPRLWHKKEPTALWSVNGIIVTPPPVSETTPTRLWGKNPSATAPIFANMSLESLRSRREFATKTFSAPPDGLWKKQISEPVVERPSIGLWGATGIAPIVSEAPLKTAQLWQKDNVAAPMFANLPVESCRPKRDHTTIPLPVFSGSMWKKQVALPKKPELWKPTPKSTHLWDSNSRTKNLAQILLEKKANATKKPLWTKDQASRTTEKTPQRSPLITVRISNNTTLAKATGDLWKPKTAKKQIPQLWTPPKPAVKIPIPAGTLLWAKGHASRTTEAVPERTKVAFRPSDAPLSIVSGSLWKPKSPAKKIRLWERSIKTVATYPQTSVSAPLWSKELASRTTTARPERSTFVPKKKEVTITLPKASGSLWKPKAAAPVKELWKAAIKPAVTRPRRESLLWSEHLASRTTTATPIRTTVSKRVVDSPLPVVSGTLWHQKPAMGPKGLWKRAIKTVATYRRTSVPALLWSKELASRTTTARPSRGPFVPKTISKSHILPAATGELWQPKPTTSEPLTLWTRNTASPATGLWDAAGRTPSLVEIKRQFTATRDPLWQRRSVPASKAACTIVKPAAPAQKKFKTSSRPIGPADGSLWQPISPILADPITMWLTRSSRSSSIDEEFISPNLSRASTLSDMSECEDSPPSTGEDDFATGIARVHITKASMSSAAGEMLWQRATDNGGEKKQELAMWTGAEASSARRSVLVAERPMRMPLPEREGGELKVFDKSHELWRPSEMDEESLHETLCGSSGSEGDFHDAESHDAEFEFHDAESQLSEGSQHEDFDYAERKRHGSASAEVMASAKGRLWGRCTA